MTSLSLLLLFHLIGASFIQQNPKVSAEERNNLYTAVDSLRSLVVSQERVVFKLKKYILSEEHKLNVLMTYLDHFEENRKILKTPRFLRNSLNSFALINRLGIDNSYIENLLENNAEFCTKNLTLPRVADLTGAAIGLTRVETTYQANLTDISNCTYKGLNCTPMTSSDCFEMARSLFRANKIEKGLAWTQLTLSLYNEDTDLNEYGIKKLHLFKHLSYAYYWMNDTKSAMTWVQKVFESYSSMLTLDELYKVNVLKMMIQEKEVELFTLGIVPPEVTKYEKFLMKYQKVCRGEINISPVVAKKLKCRYLTDHHPFLNIAPLKMEQLYTEPDITIFYDLVNDKDVNVLKNRINPDLLQQSSIVSYFTGDKTDIRIGKSCWIKDQSGRVEKLTQRLEDCSGLDMKTADLIQVTNYGVGGHFEPHFDYYEEMDVRRLGNRLATILIYLTDVEEGGETVFPDLGLRIKPQLGTGVYFTNLLQTGKGNPDTLHAACPVIKGDKWIATKWIHEVGQEFRKPCDLVYNYTIKAPRHHEVIIVNGYPAKLYE